jgi:hypothetical protein
MKELVAMLCKAMTDASGEERVFEVLFAGDGLWENWRMRPMEKY